MLITLVRSKLTFIVIRSQPQQVSYPWCPCPGASPVLDRHFFYYHLRVVSSTNAIDRLGLNGSGWARQENTNVMPDAKEMAGVDMRLEPGAYRELHWHVASEWSIVLNGSCRIQACLLRPSSL